MERHLDQTVTRSPKRRLNTNEFISPSTFHHVHHQKQARLCQQKALNQNRSFSPIHFDHRFEKKSKHSFSYTSLNSHLKEYNLSKKDFVELRHALQILSHYLQPRIRCGHQQRLTSPYLQQQLTKDDQSLLPLYTNEYFIRNGLLNHNDGPEIYDDIFPSKNLYYTNQHKPILRSFPSSLNTSLPLALLPNQKHFFAALTSNFASEQPRCSQSSMRLTEFEYQGKSGNNELETESMRIRRNKVQTWERKNILQHTMSIGDSLVEVDDQMDPLEYHRSSLIRTSSSNNDEKSVALTTALIAENSSSLRTCNKGEGNDKSVTIKHADDFFPMVKKLAPYIIIRNSFRHTDDLRTAPEKRSPTAELDSTSTKTKRQSLLLPPSFTVQHTQNEPRAHQRKKNYLLTEFESVLTVISKP